MPVPGTNIPWPWEPQPSTPPDTTQRDQLIKTLAGQHGGQVGAASTPLVKDPSGNEVPGPYDLYTFGDGTTIEVAPTGEVAKYTIKTPEGKVTGWTDITQIRNADQSITFYGKDPKDPGGPLKPVEGLPTSAAPASTAVTPTASVSQWERVDKDGNNADQTGKPAVAVRDPKTNTTIDLPKDPTGTVTAVGNALWVVKPDGSATPATGPDGKQLTKPADKTTTNITGLGLVEYDPATGNARVVLAAPADPTKEVFQLGGDGHTYRWDVASKSFVDSGLPPNKEAGSVYDPGEQSDSFMILGKDGSVLSTQKKPGWTRKPPFQPGQPTTSTTLPKIPSIDPQTGQIVYTDNPNRITASQATSDLAKSLGVKVAAGEMSEEDAQKLITNAINGMNAQTSALSGMGTAAGNALQSITQGAQVGAGLLQNRVTAATGALQNIMGQATGSNMIAAPAAGTAGKLVSGLQGWVTELGGGQGAYDAAANLVQRADPTNQLGGDAAGAYAALGQAFQKYRDLTGTAHPLEQAAASATQANQPGGMPAPGAQPVAAASIPGPFTGPPPSLPAGPTGAPTNAVPGANYGTGYNTAQLAGPRWPNPQPLPPGTQVPYAFQSPAASTTTPTSSGGTININVH